MNYIVEYEISALLFLIVVTQRFFSMRKLPSHLNRLFGMLLHCAILDITLDVTRAYTIDNVSDIPVWLNYLVNTAFYTLQILFPALMITYVLALCGKKPRGVGLLIYTPSLVSEGFLLTNIFTGLIFSVKETVGGTSYVRGSLFNILYVCSCVYMIMTLVAVAFFRHNLRRHELFTIFAYKAIVIVAMSLQYCFPNELLTGVALSLGILMMYFTMQNPEVMLDKMTGVFNNSAFTEYLRVSVAEKHGIWLTVVDVGGIRRINGVLGLRAGNKMLENVGIYFNQICTSRSMVFRMMGTRFLFCAENEEEHYRIVQSVSDRFKSPWKYNGMDISLLVTVRYCEEINYFTTSDDAINLIDLAYSKSAGGDYGTTKPIGADILLQSRRAAQIEEALRRALSLGKGFTLNFQPLYSVSGDGFFSAEVLLRFTDPELGRISPSEFIPVAENIGLIHQIDLLVLEMACDFMKRHPELFKAGLELLEINLSAVEFYNDTSELTDNIVQKISSFENRICFEVTETAATKHREILSDFMEGMIKHGVSFAIDDFGTGYANISQISKLPFSIVKLDRTFVMSEKFKDKIILEDLVKMFDRIGLDTVIEGVETKEQAKFAIGLDVSQIQGFYFSRPVPEEEFVQFMLKSSSKKGKTPLTV